MSTTQEAREDLAEFESVHPRLMELGLPTFVDPFSRAWSQSSGDEKLEMLVALARTWSEPPKDLYLSMVLPLLMLGHHRIVTLNNMIVGGAVMIRAALDPHGYALPMDEPSLRALRAEAAPLTDGRTARAFLNRLRKARVPELTRCELDAMSSQGTGVSLEHKVERIRLIIQSGFSFVGAVCTYGNVMRRNASPHVVHDLPSNLFGIAAGVVVAGLGAQG